VLSFLSRHVLVNNDITTSTNIADITQSSQSRSSVVFADNVRSYFVNLHCSLDTDICDSAE